MGMINDETFTDFWYTNLASQYLVYYLDIILIYLVYEYVFNYIDIAVSGCTVPLYEAIIT